ncbi:hypothetical protein V2H45_20690, partial [Tumidithrix elongata RA019]|nr:hypothetical protein [Tumidithrix elongata RA019]
MSKEDRIDKLLQIDALKRQQANKVTHLLATEIKEKLLGVKILTRQYYEPNHPVENFVILNNSSGRESGEKKEPKTE